MIQDVECGVCNGLGKIHNDDMSDDPDDEGVDCPACEGTGVVAVDIAQNAPRFSDDD